MEYTITDFGAVGDGKTINTSFIQKAIDAAEKAGGGISDISVKDMNINFVNPPFKVPPHKVENRGKCAVEICGAKNISLENINVKVDETLKNVFTDFSKHTNGENIKEVNCNFNV